MVGLTAATAAAAFVLAWIARYQLKQQSQDTAEALRLSREANQASVRSANATERALLVAHRPKIAIRHILVDGIDHGEIGERLYNGVAWVINIGALPVTLVSAHAEWLLKPRLPMRNPVLAVLDTSTIEKATLMSSEVAKIPIPDRTIGMDEHIELWGDRKTDKKTGKRLYLIGFVKYYDAIGRRRRHFCYRYSPRLQRFVKINHPNYSYED